MNKILEKRELVKDIHEMVVEAPLVAAKAQAGHFVLVMADEVGERKRAGVLLGGWRGSCPATCGSPSIEYAAELELRRACGDVQLRGGPTCWP